jgi:hypothetical protein
MLAAQLARREKRSGARRAKFEIRIWKSEQIQNPKSQSRKLEASFEFSCSRLRFVSDLVLRISDLS